MKIPLSIASIMPRVELVRLRPIDFFPPPLTPDEIKRLTEICIGTKTRTIGDALMNSSLPRLLRKHYPNLTVTTYTRAFNPVVFLGNPDIAGADPLPPTLYGDDCSSDRGHIIRAKENYFGVAPDEPCRPEIYLLPSEREWAARWLDKLQDRRPICILHPTGHTWSGVVPETFWPRLIEKWKKQFIFIQVGLASDTPLPGIAARYAAGQSFATARQLFALMERASLLIGINSAPMHVARAFDLPSLILTRQGNIQEIFRNRSETPYYLRDNWKHGFLYEENRHFDFLTEAAESAQSVADDFLSSARYNSRE